MSYRFDVAKLVSRFGGVMHLSDSLNRIKLRPTTPNAIYKWIERETMPLAKLLDLVELADLEGRSLHLSSYIIKD